MRAPVNGSTGPLQNYARLGAGMRHLFVRGRGFSTDASMSSSQCGIASLSGQFQLTDPSFPCPAFQVGDAFAAAGVQVWDVANAFDLPPGTTVFPTRSFSDPTNKPMLDMATVYYDAANCSGGATCDHTSKSGPRQWNFPTLGYSTFGSPSQYGRALVLARAFKAYFLDRPYMRQQAPVGTFLPLSAAGKPMLAPLTVVCDKSAKGVDDGTAQTGECPGPAPGVPGGDVYRPGQFSHQLSAMDVNNDGCVELPFVADPTTLGTCDQLADSATTPQATLQQVIRSVTTHELGHAVGINVHTSDAADLMYMYSINWIRDGHFSPQGVGLIQIHNKGQQ
jgi:hypothetical protein